MPQSCKLFNSTTFTQQNPSVISLFSKTCHMLQQSYVLLFILQYLKRSGFGGCLGVACWLLVPKFGDSNPAKAVGFLRAKKILSTHSFGGEVKPSVLCRRFATCKKSLNGVEVVISAKLPDNILAHSSTFRRWDLSRRGGRGGTWWRKWERLKARESNGKLPLRIYPECSVPTPYQSPD
jgi:hypothetical protein